MPKEIKNKQHYDLMDETKYILTDIFREEKEGFITGTPIVTNVGVFTYRDKDGKIIRELRPPEEVFDENSLNTLRLKPITNNHPKDLVTIDNVKKYEIGTTGDSVYKDSYAVSVPISIRDEKSINDIKNGKRALSCGYIADLDFTPGNWMGVPYDAIQRNIRYNHVAIVDKGRAGDLAVMRLDSNEAILINDSLYIDNNDDGGKNMSDNLKRIVLDGVDYQAEAAVVTAYTQIKKDNEKVKKDFDNFKTEKQKELSQLQANLDTANDKLNKANEEIEKLKNETISDEAIEKAVQEKVELKDNAKKAGIEKTDGKSNLDIKKEIIMKVFPEAKLDEKDVIYIDARYDSAIDILKTENENTINNKKKVFGNLPKNDGSEVIIDSKKAYRDYIDRLNGKEDK
jgi:hypothetical protein